MLQQPVGLFKLMLDLFHMIYVQGKDLLLHDFMKYTIDTDLPWGTHKLICFRLGIMLDTAKHYSMIPV